MSFIKKHLFWFLIAIQVVVLITGIMHYSRAREDLVYSNEELFLARNGIPEESGFYVDGNYEGKQRRISTPAFLLNKGIYNAYVASHIENDQLFVPYSRVIEVPDGKTLSFELSERVEEQYYVLSDKEPLRNYQPEISYRFYVRADNAPLALICAIDNKEKQASDSPITDTWLLVNSVRISYDRVASVLRFIIIWLTVFAVVDLLYLFLRNKESFLRRMEPHKWVLLSLVMIFVFSEIPMLLPYLPHGGDLHFHLQRLGGLARGLSDGVFPVKIQPLWNNGYGDAAGTMYGDFLLYTAALLYNAGFTIDFAYKFYVFLINLLTVIFAYYTGKTIFKDRTIAVLMCAFYTLSPYRMLDVYGRASMGEYTAMAFLPLVALGMYLIYKKGESDKPLQGFEEYGWIVLAVGFFGVVTSHALSIIMVGSFMLIYALIEYKKTFSRKLFPEFLKAAFLSGGLGLYFLVPFIDYYINVPMRVNDYLPGTGIYSENMTPLPQVFALPLAKETFGGGPLYLVVIAVAIWLYLKYKETRNRHISVSIVLCLVLIWMSSNFFPYAWMNHVFYIPYSAVLEQLQFPWRWISILSVFCFLLFGWELKVLKGAKIERKLVECAFILMAVIITTQSYLYTDIYCRETEKYDYINVSVTNAWGWDYEVAREYAPRHLTMDSVHPLEIEHNDGVVISNESRQSLKFWLNVENKTDKDETLVFPVFAYKGYKAILPDGSTVPIETGHDFRVKLTIPAHTTWTGLHLYFAETLLWRVSEAVSGITMVILAGWIVFKLVRRRKSNL